MNAPSDTALFYATLPVQRGFRALMDPAQYTPLPADWTVGMADIVQSTKAIAEKRYKAVNMAGAAVIAALTNALEGREFPFVFGGDGASFAVAPGDVETARAALAATAAWANSELGLTLRVALIPIAAIRAQGSDVRLARYAPSPNLSYAMFSGGGLAWADSAIKRGDFAVAPAPDGGGPESWPDLTGLSCRFQEIRAMQGLVLGADRAADARLPIRRPSAPSPRRSSRWSRRARMPDGRCRHRGRSSAGRRRASNWRRTPRRATRCSGASPCWPRRSSFI